MIGRTLLPPGRGAFELAVSLTSAGRRPLDADLIRRVRDPWTCPVELLPWLANAYGVKLWYEDWSEFRKRSMIAASMGLRAREGTLAGAEGYLGFVDATVLRAQRPPSKIFLTGGITDAQREAYLAGLPQIRIYPFDFRGTAPRSRAFLKLGRAFLGHIWLQASRGPQMYGRRATIQLPDGQETAVSVEALPDFSGQLVERITVTTTAKRRPFLGHGSAALGRMYLRGNRAASLTSTVRLSDDALTAFVALSGAEVQDVRPVRVQQTRTAPVGRFFLGRDFLGAKRPHLCESAGPRMIYDRIALLDPNAPAAQAGTLHRGRAYLGSCRFGVRPFTAELMLSVPMHRSRWRIGLGRGGFLRGFLRPADLEPLNRARAALTAAKAVDDTLLIDTEVFRRVKLGDGRKLGSFKLGQYLSRI